MARYYTVDNVLEMLDSDSDSDFDGFVNSDEETEDREKATGNIASNSHDITDMHAMHDIFNASSISGDENEMNNDVVDGGNCDDVNDNGIGGSGMDDTGMDDDGMDNSERDSDDESGSDSVGENDKVIGNSRDHRR